MWPMKKKKAPMTLNVNSHPATFRYEVDPIAHLAHQTDFTRTGKMNMLNRKPVSTGKKYLTLADGTRSN